MANLLHIEFGHEVREFLQMVLFLHERSLEGMTTPRIFAPASQSLSRQSRAAFAVVVLGVK